MGRKGLLAALLVIAGAAAVRAADSGDVRAVLERYRTVRPTMEDLAIFDLDWAPTFGEAKARAAKGNRPIFLIVVTNSFGNMCSGHC
jgi:hypothetical protein